MFNETEAVQIGQMLRKARLARKLTQEDLALMLDVSRETIRSVEQGRRRPSHEMATKLNVFFDSWISIRCPACNSLYRSRSQT